MTCPHCSELRGVACGHCETGRRPLSRAQWLKRRRDGLGGSDIATMLGLSPWTTPHELAAEKLHGSTWDGNEATRCGQLLEPLILEGLAKVTGGKAGHGVELLRHHGWADGVRIQANTDGHLLLPPPMDVYTPEPRSYIAECKSSTIDYWRGLPIYWWLQIQTYLSVCLGAEGAFVGILLGPRHRSLWFDGWELNRKALSFRWQPVPRNQEAIELIESAACWWWDACITHGSEPPHRMPQANRIECLYLDSRKARNEVDRGGER